MNFRKTTLLCLFVTYLSLSFADVNVPITMPPELKCSGCWVVARQYKRQMKATGKDALTIQTGHRMGKDNKIPRKSFRESEIRVIEVMETLCDRSWLEKWHVGETNRTKYLTIDPNDHSSTRDSEGYFAPQRNIATMLEHFCAFMVEEHEESIEELVRSDATVKEFRRKLCVDLTRFCQNDTDPTPKEWKPKPEKPERSRPPPRPSSQTPADPSSTDPVVSSHVASVGKPEETADGRSGVSYQKIERKEEL